MKPTDPWSFFSPKHIEFYPKHAYSRVRKDTRLPLCRLLESFFCAAPFSLNSVMHRYREILFPVMTRVKRTTFAFPLQANEKLNKISETTVFRHWTAGAPDCDAWGKKKTKRTYSLLGSTFLIIQQGGSSRAMFGYLTELRNHRLVREREWVGVLGQSCREEGTVRKERASEIYLGDIFSLP